jgi:hypothetical protein
MKISSRKRSREGKQVRGLGSLPGRNQTLLLAYGLHNAIEFNAIDLQCALIHTQNREERAYKYYIHQKKSSTSDHSSYFSKAERNKLPCQSIISIFVQSSLLSIFLLYVLKKQIA